MLVIRAWVEDHPTAPLRAVVTEALDVGHESSRQAFGSVDAVCAAVRAWLEDLVLTAAPPGDAPVTDE